MVSVTFTALLMLMFSRLIPFTSSSLSPTHRPACSTHMVRECKHKQNEPNIEIHHGASI
uniref:Uncharacterized protein n=1 Tax=Pygocentrus nattereri TaxID=42514 RepID=A0AAR2J2X0_PYGNA